MAKEVALFKYRAVGDKDATATSTCTPSCARPAMKPPCVCKIAEGMDWVRLSECTGFVLVLRAKFPLLKSSLASDSVPLSRMYMHKSEQG